MEHRDAQWSRGPRDVEQATDRGWDGGPDEEYDVTDKKNSRGVFFCPTLSDSFT